MMDNLVLLKDKQISRRTFIAGLATISTIAINTGCESTSTTSPVNPSPTSRQGTTLFTYKDHHNAVNGAVWSPDGQLVVSVSSDKTGQVWNAFSGSRLSLYQGLDPLYSLALSPNGMYAVSGGDAQQVCREGRSIRGY